MSYLFCKHFSAAELILVCGVLRFSLSRLVCGGRLVARLLTYSFVGLALIGLDSETSIYSGEMEAESYHQFMA